ncbi:uncharacterized protein LOC114961096 [Acropora millepora]|uniref:uncharacterized protein LOC114961096 n=1 Tax=Acropora millepora TaxID=45264 RepID=UPI001CF2A3D0|nr:uncharacterized protein LOC114961096 [Acropora millepora]XP_044173210.1 uncharacterized protein LOC114961096 [Acropora millepora]XP_044173211.1 uncharacterized protein LOC114961096 [Acropora millepora]XP_044173212.1 uncharacterized protein LOC114961096 [Acropora millepora]
MGKLSVCFLAFLITLCATAPTKKAEDKVISLLTEWIHKLSTSTRKAFETFNRVHFSAPGSAKPLHRLILRPNLVAENNNYTSKNATEAMCRQVSEFITPVYLVYHYEKKRLDSDVELTKLLLNASVILNATSEMAEYFRVRRFPNATQTQAVKMWSRDVLRKEVQSFKELIGGSPNSLEELQNWSILYELSILPNVLFELLDNIQRLLSP